MTDAIMQRRAETAFERYQRDERFRAQVQSVVAHVMNTRGPVDPERADRDAYRIATDVAAMVLEMVLRDDAELSAQRALADRYRQLAEQSLSYSTGPLILAKERLASPGNGG